MSSLAPALRGG